MTWRERHPDGGELAHVTPAATSTDDPKFTAHRPDRSDA